MVLPVPSVLLHQMTPHTTGGPVYSTDTGRTQTHTPQHLNPHPTGGNRLPRNPKIPEAKPIPLLTQQTNATRVMKMTTPNRAAQMDPAAPAVLEVPMVLEVLAAPATTLPMSKTCCRNS